MKTIGIIGGMSWESTATYYKLMNTYTRDLMGGLHSAKLIIFSVDFHEIEYYQSRGEWEKCAEKMILAAQALERAGADFIVISTNTMHNVATQVKASVKIPLLHIAEATSRVLKDAGHTKVALLGTKYTMQLDFYKDVLKANGIEVLIPNIQEIDEINRIIFEELCVGVILETSRKYYQKAILKLQENGAQAVILGCTEIGMLIEHSDCNIPVFDTTEIHAKAAVDCANK
ncbi:aspartate/glutamate racemase family protein [Erysipelothrix sp. HDW6C]|uniref:aspartate/glutamate racemase family protein n=1 Tax=Erysipelothrix sp. HDW6C TaxID=2714930 RepID=UPI001409BAAC|nr:aspartate/glutamate racemase family protein [Erysipelothrix sp. HDW6C]QIK69601.1 aspartate/glutamate racemase family protein [Erysipelothrix sp. HDW6C]